MLKRYAIETPPYSPGRMDFDQDGEWVRYDDIIEIINAAIEITTWDWEGILRNLCVDSDLILADIIKLENSIIKISKMEQDKILGL